MAVLYLANIVAVALAAWSVWIRRDTFHSRWDRANTAAIALIGIGAVLDSPWRGMAAASYDATGKFYLLNTLGHICYLTALGLSLESLYRRLLPDDDVVRFMKTRIAPLVVVAAVIMLVAVLMSPATSTMSAYHLYLVRPDGWLTLYWVTDLTTLLLLSLVSTYGLVRVRSAGRSPMVDLLVAGTAVGVLSGLAVTVGLLTSDPQRLIPTLVWPLCYLATAATAVAHAWAWRHRVSSGTTTARDVPGG